MITENMQGTGFFGLPIGVQKKPGRAKQVIDIELRSLIDCLSVSGHEKGD